MASSSTSPRPPQAVWELSQVPEGPQLPSTEQAKPSAWSRPTGPLHCAVLGQCKEPAAADCKGLISGVLTHQEVCRRRQRGLGRAGKS